MSKYKEITEDSSLNDEVDKEFNFLLDAEDIKNKE